ncbi:restriction endonuclease subunit S [Chryseolinea lacunae]|uniref:Restriction endonuclease subunit S n=1 Tax=Chryseolinea lacunae TaxID=2801331 RepID=A0ABS1KYN5_9BACT|nr:restriction endonuclease subunit S [Chryseolinea lacunae]MBL0744342.1 restriction endonuclease subunit S [Chryseolinea lacunae]
MIATCPINSLLIKIFSGYSFRRRIIHDDDGDLRVIQMKDLMHHYSAIKISGLTRVYSENLERKTLLAKGDVLLVAKGAHNCALEYDLNLPMAIASSAFFVLRPDPEKVLPAYLAWYLNQSNVQNFFAANQSGSYMLSVAKTTLERVTVQLPSREIQEKIVAVDKLVRKEGLLMQSIMQKKKMLVTSALMKLVDKKV